jgi:transcriptional regulator with XRE-family HTH domain
MVITTGNKWTTASLVVSSKKWRQLLRPRVKNTVPGELSKNVKELRLAMGLTQQQFAHKMHTAITTIARWETGRAPRGKSLLDLAKLAQEGSMPELAAKFFNRLCSEFGDVVRDGYRELVEANWRESSGMKRMDPLALRGLVDTLRDLARVAAEFDAQNFSLEQALKAGKEVQNGVRRIAELVLIDGERALWGPSPAGRQPAPNRNRLKCCDRALVRLIIEVKLVRLASARRTLRKASQQLICPFEVFAWPLNRNYSKFRSGPSTASFPTPAIPERTTGPWIGWPAASANSASKSRCSHAATGPWWTAIFG